MKPRLSQRFQFSLVYVLVAAVVLSLLQSWLLAPRTVELFIGDKRGTLNGLRYRDEFVRRKREEYAGTAPHCRMVVSSAGTAARPVMARPAVAAF